jgi:hypothetical protein
METEKKTLDELVIKCSNQSNVILSYFGSITTTKETFHFEVNYDHKNIIRSLDRVTPCGKVIKYLRLDDKDHEWHTDADRLCFIMEETKGCDRCNIPYKKYMERFSIFPVGCRILGEIAKKEGNYQFETVGQIN